MKDDAPRPAHRSIQPQELARMQRLGTTAMDRDALMSRLADMPAFLESTLACLSATEARIQGPEEAFSPVEQCWHLADLEREGFGARIRRLLEESAPTLPDFDGARLAEERDYAARSVADGLAAFRAAREANLRTLRSIDEDAWQRPGMQDGVGPITLCDLPSMMAAHDEAHRREIDAWREARRRDAKPG